MLLPFLILYVIIHQTLQVNLTAKCCEKDFEVQERNNILNCKKRTNSRIEVWSHLNNFLKAASEGECFDSSSGDFFLYKVNSSVLVVKKQITISTAAFPKCCPLNYVYNKKTHSCEISQNRGQNYTEDFINRQLVKVGLPHCQMIIDNTIKKNLSNSLQSTFNNLEQGTYCFDKDVRDQYIARECQKGLDICERKRCFRKCCPDGQSFVNGGNCMDTYVHGLNLVSQSFSPYIIDPDDEYELIYGVKCGKVALIASNRIQYSIKKRGEFSYFHNLTRTFVQHSYSDLRSYCLEHATKGNISGYYLFWCFDPIPLDEKFSYTLWSKILSCVFLLVSMVVYFYLDEIKTTFGKILINYCLTMIFLMITLILAQISREPGRTSCKIKAYLLIFFNMSAFVWVNIMALDIWWTFGKPRPPTERNQRKKTLKKFLLYFLYGWGVPLCHTLLILLFDMTKILPDSIQPSVGIYSCFLANVNYARTVLLLIPQLIFQIIDTVLFILTITYCIKVKTEINKMRDSVTNRESGRFSADKERLGLIVKLAVIMGVIWIFEVTTAFFDNMNTYSGFTKILEIILDNISCIQGVFIFIIFICKKKMINSLKSKLGMGERKSPYSMSAKRLITTNETEF